MQPDLLIRATQPLPAMPAIFCGVDEAGRGPLAGPVVAAAVILDPQHPLEGLRDSKKLSAAQRNTLATRIRDQALAWSVARAEVEEIDRLNILQATLLAMTRALNNLPLAPALVCVDGLYCPPWPASRMAIVRGDARVPAISAASILAKTERDALLLELAHHYPQYQFERHKGYPTALHLSLLHKHGPSPAHRRTFGPVADCRRNLELW